MFKLLCIFSFCAAVSATTWHDGKYNAKWGDNCDFYGNDIAKVNVGNGVCGDACAQNSQCTHFTWLNGVCYLKRFTSPAKERNLASGVCGWINRPKPASAIKWNNGKYGKYDAGWGDNCDFYGNDIAKTNAGHGTCGDDCYRNSQCTHFTWLNGICYLKRFTKPATARNLASGVCGWINRPKPASAIKWNNGKFNAKWGDNCDFYGNDIAKVNVGNGVCGDACAKNSKCTHFTWLKGVCYLKRFTKPAKARNLASGVCGWINRRAKLQKYTVHKEHATGTSGKCRHGLATIRSRDDLNAAIKAIGGKKGEYWIGLHNVGDNKIGINGWTWSDGTKLTRQSFVNWSPVTGYTNPQDTNLNPAKGQGVFINEKGQMIFAQDYAKVKRPLLCNGYRHKKIEIKIKVVKKVKHHKRV